MPAQNLRHLRFPRSVCPSPSRSFMSSTLLRLSRSPHSLLSHHKSSRSTNSILLLMAQSILAHPLTLPHLSNLSPGPCQPRVRLARPVRPAKPAAGAYGVGVAINKKRKKLKKRRRQAVSLVDSPTRSHLNLQEPLQHQGIPPPRFKPNLPEAPGSRGILPPRFKSNLPEALGSRGIPPLRLRPNPREAPHCRGIPLTHSQLKLREVLHSQDIIRSEVSTPPWLRGSRARPNHPKMPEVLHNVDCRQYPDHLCTIHIPYQRRVLRRRHHLASTRMSLADLRLHPGCKAPTHPATHHLLFLTISPCPNLK